MDIATATALALNASFQTSLNAFDIIHYSESIASSSVFRLPDCNFPESDFLHCTCVCDQSNNRSLFFEFEDT